MIDKIPIEFVQIDEGIHLLVEVTINGFAVNLVIDTGASRTVLDKNTIDLFMIDQLEETDEESTSIGNQTLKSQKAVVKELLFGKISLINKEVNVLDLSNVIHVYESLNLPMIHGILGAELLQELNAIIDFKEKTITVSD
jgi:predicted aspartyl protease